MAIDTAAKRASALLQGFVIPSGTIDQAEGQAAAWLYSGVLAGYTPPTTPAGHNFVSVGAGRPLVSNLSKRFINKIGR